MIHRISSEDLDEGISDKKREFDIYNERAAGAIGELLQLKFEKISLETKTRRRPSRPGNIKIAVIGILIAVILISCYLKDIDPDLY